eukprot:TRINITY_DN4767_c0_g1_i2.p1 TRINITY_DN4767_c0_g1~~TRINITY_DN4767_c0_g1_i2.p1  ORF type:complete len:117 (+),score=5.12 TRINITY_DN4767_c0_g1_i2:105-455(+)
MFVLGVVKHPHQHLPHQGMFAHPKIRGTFHHTSFFRGGAIQCVGMFDVKDGKIVFVKPHSGHYRPRKIHMKRIVTYLEDRLGPRELSHIKIKMVFDAMLELYLGIKHTYRRWTKTG